MRHSILGWLAAEPFRVFFLSGAFWSIVGVSLWPLFYAGKLEFYPVFCHARLMIEVFGGAFVVGFLGTAGPRMASAPKLKPWELIWLLALHQAGAICHLRLQHVWGDMLFVAMIVSLLACLLVRVVRFRKEMPPPQMLLPITGLICGASGALLTWAPFVLSDPRYFRLAGLLLYQGLLLPPVLGIGSFIFPRILGGDFGEPGSRAESSVKVRRAIVTVALLVGSFFVEAMGWPLAGRAMRVIAAVAYLLLEIRWRRNASGSPRGTLAAGVSWALLSGGAGLALAGFYEPQHIALEHLLYIGGFGLLIVVVASRVLFGHSGELPAFSQRSWMARLLIFLGLLAALTRAVTAFLPQLTVSHHIYAAWSWVVLMGLWILWHRRRFVKREEEARE